MYALLFDRRSLIVTGTVLAGMGILLFAAGFLLGALLTWERELVPPRWLEYGPLAPDAQRVVDSRPAQAPPLPSTAPEGATGAAGATGSGAATPVPGVGGAAGEAGPAEPDPGEPAPGTDGGDGWVPFARPGEVEALLSQRTAEAASRAGGSGTVASPAARVREQRSRAGSSQAGAVQDGPVQDRPVTAAARPAAGGGWYVQTGAFSVAEYARAEQRVLEEAATGEAYGAYLEEVTDRRGRRLTAVRLGPFPSRSAADDVAARFEDALVGHRAPS